jgi:predicted Zn finger-like uncharacterized protein
MIVTCEQCQTRFKIPDEKVTDKGVKVRCSKCSHTFRVTKPVDPFARFGAGSEPNSAEVTRPGVFALGVEATKSPALGSKRAASSNSMAPAATPGGDAVPFDFSSLSPPAAVPSLQVPRAPEIPAPPAPPAFDFSALAVPSLSAPVTGAAPSAFDFSSFVAPSVEPAAPVPEPAEPFSQPFAPAPSFDFSTASQVTAAPGTLPSFEFERSSSPSGDRFSAHSSAAAPVNESSPFGGAEGARALFDMPEPSALPDIPLPEEEIPPPVEIPLPHVRPSSPQSVVNASPMRRSTRWNAVGVVVHVFISTLLVMGGLVVGSAFLNEDKLSIDSLSLENLRNTFAPSVDFYPVDVSNGLYETRAGRSVFFVRGDVVNHSHRPVRVVVRAEIVEGDKVVRFAESWAGAPATPEEIHLIDSLDALNALNVKVEKRATEVPANGAAQFVVAFTEYPPQLNGFRVRVVPRAAPATETSLNP